MSYGYTSYDSGGLAAAILGVLLVLALPGLIIFAITVVMQWKIFKKAGEEGWKAIIPIYNVITLLKIVNIKPLFILVLLIPIVGSIAFAIIGIMAGIRLCRGFGKSDGFIVGYFLLHVVFGLILAFDDSTWDASRINMESMSFLNNTEAPASKANAPKAEEAPKTTPEDPWVNGEQK